jgi:hypothetical protein
MKHQQWQTYIEARKQSSQTKRAYARQHSLPYSQFLYWYSKLTEPTPMNDTSDFISVDIKRTAKPVDNLGVLEFPNGIKLVIHSPELLVADALHKNPT